MTNREQYRHFCKKEKLIPLFSRPWHLDAVLTTERWEVALVEKSGQIVASLPYCLKKKGPFQIITQPPFTKMMGPFIIPEYDTPKHQNSILKQLIDQLPPVAAFEQNFHYSMTNWLPFYWQGYQQSTFYSFVLNDLSDLDKVYAKFDRHYRNKIIPDAEKQLRLVTDRTLKEFHEVFGLSFQRQGLANPIAFDDLKKYDEAMKKNEAREIFFAVDDADRIHSVLYLAWDDQSAYYHLAGDDPALRNSGSGIWIAWEVIQYTRNVLGLNVFDFEGSMIPGIEKVRRKMGAQQMPYFNVRKYNSKAYQFLQRLKRGVK